MAAKQQTLGAFGGKKARAKTKTKARASSSKKKPARKPPMPST